MTRRELAAIIADLIKRKAITAAEGATLLQRFDDGELIDIPVPPPAQDDNDWLLALAMLMLLLNRRTVRPLSGQEQERARKALRTQFEQRTAAYAATVAGGASVADWQAGMQSNIAAYARQMAVAGAGTLPSPNVRSGVNARLAEQWGYLAAFAVTLLAKRVAEREVSEAAIRQRAGLYGGVGWGSFYAAQDAGRGANWVTYYIALDDRKTCSACSDAARNGPYLPGRSPLPGSICYGGGRCRCRLRHEYNPAIYAQLGGP